MSASWWRLLLGERSGGALCLLAVALQSVLPFAHAAFEGQGPTSEIGIVRSAAFEPDSEPSDADADHASCPLCQFVSASRHVVLWETLPPRVYLEPQRVHGLHGTCVTVCRVDVTTAGPRGPPVHS